MMKDFEKQYKLLTGDSPFPWHTRWYQHLVTGEYDKIAISSLPTGMGKTSLLAVWLIAASHYPEKIARRLVYVVNRRTVVDQTTVVAEKLFNNAVKAGVSQPAISTLRGQFADNGDWCADPSRPAIICGTVDMIGSRLLFSGYGIGFKKRPLHAGFLGQDALLIHDEAHLEPAFQRLVESIQKEQDRCKDYKPLRVIELTATARGKIKPFELTSEEKAVPRKLPEEISQPLHIVWQRLAAKKGIRFHGVKRDSVAKQIGELARDCWRTSGKAILIYVRTIEDVKTVREELSKKRKDGPEDSRLGIDDNHIQVLTGTLRGKERDQMAYPTQSLGCPIFARFLTPPKDDAPEHEQWKVTPTEGTVYLICTSAGEVGVDISADHLVCDLSTLDSMAQRFGRVNRRGWGRAEIDIVFETDRNPKPTSPEYEAARWETKKALDRLPMCDWNADLINASPQAMSQLIGSLADEERKACFAPIPTILPVTDILFDAWALTSIRNRLPGRPLVEPYLHGLATGWQPPETQVAWREEVDEIKGDLLDIHKPEDLLDDYPLKPKELLKEPSYRAIKEITKLANRHPNASAWLIDSDDKVTIVKLSALADKDEKDAINGKTVLLPPSVGGLSNGMLDGNAEVAAEDVSYIKDERIRVWSDDTLFGEKTEGMRLIRRIELSSSTDDDADAKSWEWFEKPLEGGSTDKKPVEWHVHVGDVEKQTKLIIKDLHLSDALRAALKLAAKYHDHGKRRQLFQTMLGNINFAKPLAKSGKKGGRIAEKYRHEFGSLFDISKEQEFKQLDVDQQELVLHLIAAHHGRARPHFPADEAFDPDANRAETEAMAAAIPRRFARLQRKYGRWGLAYIESLLRAADWAASANPSEFLKEDEQ